MFCSLEKLKIGMSASLLLGMFLTAHGASFRGRVDSGYLVSKAKNVNWGECEKIICGKDVFTWIECHFAYTESKECYQINFPLQLLLKWGFREKILIEDKNMKIYYFYTNQADIMTEKPRFWWLYDNFSKGRNFGTAGSAMDFPVGNVVWKNTATGPRAGSPLLYAEGTNREQVSIKPNGNLLIDMLSNFTISTWIKSEKVKGNMSILAGEATRFEFYPSKDRNQLGLNFGLHSEQIYTTRNNTGHYDWRHVAVVYTPGSRPTFFLNGNVWPLEHNPRVTVWNNQTYLTMWNLDYHGQIACVMVFQAALSQSQIKILKDNCP